MCFILLVLPGTDWHPGKQRCCPQAVFVEIFHSGCRDRLIGWRPRSHQCCLNDMTSCMSETIRFKEMTDFILCFSWKHREWIILGQPHTAVRLHLLPPTQEGGLQDGGPITSRWRTLAGVPGPVKATQLCTVQTTLSGLAAGLLNIVSLGDHENKCMFNVYMFYGGGFGLFESYWKRRFVWRGWN